MLEGEISQIQLIERLVELWRESFTGAIRFENDGIIKIVYFKSGDILSASTNDRSDSIDEILMRAGKVSREHVKQALAKRKENETLGDALLNLGFITRKELTWARRVQVVGVIRSIAAWTDGSFTIVADYLPKRDEGTLFPLPQVLVELIVTEQDRTRFERALDGGNAVFEKTADFDDVWRKLGLNEDAEAIVVEIDGAKSASDVATASGRDTFNVYKLLDALATLGVLKRVAGKPQVEPQFSLDDFASAGVADAANMWDEPVSFDAPSFQLEAEPTVEVPIEPEPLPEPELTPPVTSAWDETDEDLAIEPEPTAKMPAWDVPPREPMAVPIPAPIEPPVEAEEEQWGFDDAQIETARRASTDVVVPPAPEAAPAVKAKRAVVAEKPKRRFTGLIVALVLIALLGGAGYYGFLWWQNRQTPEPVVESRPPRPSVTTTTAPVPPPTTTTAEAAVSTQPPVVAPPATVTVAPAPAPITIAAAPAPTPAIDTTQPLPPVVARSGGGRDRLDAMARQFAANATGNFTVQIQILCDPGNVEKAMRTGGENVWFVPQTIGGRSCYRVFWGRFGTREEAQRALASVPASLRDRNSAVKAVPKG